MIRTLLGLALLAGCAQDAADVEQEPAKDVVEDDELFAEGPIFGTWLPDDYTPSAPQNLIFFGDSVTVGEGATEITREYNQLLMRWDGSSRTSRISSPLEPPVVPAQASARFN